MLRGSIRHGRGAFQPAFWHKRTFGMKYTRSQIKPCLNAASPAKVLRVDPNEAQVRGGGGEKRQNDLGR